MSRSRPGGRTGGAPHVAAARPAARIGRRPAEDGEEGVRLIERTRPDLALVDLGLPVMSGFELARRIRADADKAGSLLVALNGYGHNADVQA